MNQTAWHQTTGEDVAGRDRWLLSYADLLTLLLAFFVVMYSVSAVNETKLSELSKSLSASLNHTERTQPETLENTDATPRSPEQIVAALGIDAAFASSDPGQGNLTISLPGELLFESGASDLKSSAQSELNKLLPILKSAVGEIEVIGHTDNIPVSSQAYPSNWELSAHRAAAAVRYLEQAGIARSRLLAIGRADVEPVASNDIEQGRASNRRVEFKASEIDWARVRVLGQSLEHALKKNRRATESDETLEKVPKEAAKADQLPDIETIDPALLEQVLHDLDSGGG